MDYSRIVGLLDKYWKCETTQEEEEELRYFYNHCQPLPEQLVEYKEIFVYQEQERQIRLDDNFDRKIKAAIQTKSNVNWKKWLQLAAAIVLLVGLGQLLINVDNRNKETCQTPEQALAEVQEALRFVSGKMNRSQQLIEQNMDEMKLINQYIK